jgi:hypothetical protein
VATGKKKRGDGARFFFCANEFDRADADRWARLSASRSSWPGWIASFKSRSSATVHAPIPADHNKIDE